MLITYKDARVKYPIIKCDICGKIQERNALDICIAIDPHTEKLYETVKCVNCGAQIILKEYFPMFHIKK